MKDERDLAFWLRWVAANALSEAVGLSTVLFLGYGILGPWLEGMFEGMTAVLPALLSLAMGVLLGIFEGILVGAAQGIVLRRRLPTLALRRWIVATVIGAAIAWGLGMLPSALMSANTGGAEAATEMPEAFTYVLAAGMGAVSGVILALAQWAALRHHVRRAWLWLPANSLAWLFGMPIVFLGMGSVPAGRSMLQSALVIVTAVAAAGTVVGVVHGVVLVRMLPSRNPTVRAG